MSSNNSVMRDLNDIACIAREILYSFSVNPELTELLQETAKKIDSQRERAIANPKTLFAKR